MTPNSLLLCRDPECLHVMRRTLGEVRIGVEECTEAQDAARMLAGRRFDAVIVDCDDLDGATDVLRMVRCAPSNRRSMAFAIINGRTSAASAFEMGANFVLDKPLSRESAGRSLRAAHGLMICERRRYYRLAVEIPVCLSLQSEKREVEATITNLSEGGLAIRTREALEAGAPVWAQFRLPDSKISVEARAEVAWTLEDGRAGIRFLSIPQSSKPQFERWISEKLKGDAAALFINPAQK